MLQSFVN